MRGQFRAWWGNLTGDDLDKVAGKSDRLVGLLRRKYGYRKDHAEVESSRRLKDYPNPH